MWWLTQPLSLLFDAVMTPLGALPPALGLAVLALGTALALLWIFRRTLDARRVEAARRKMQAAIFEMRLFQDDPTAVLRAAFQVLRHNVAYLRAWLVPLLIVSLPLAMLMAQIDSYYGLSGIALSDASLVIADLRPSGDGDLGASNVVLNPPAGMRVATSPLWFPAAGQMAWRIWPQTEGQFELQFRAGREVVTKEVRASTEIGRRVQRRVQDGLLQAVRYPSEPPLPADAAITAISVDYPERRVRFLGWQTHWLVPYLGLVLLFAYVFRRRFGVVF